MLFRTHVSEFKGQRVAIDGYSWLHKGAYTCSADICLNRPTDAFQRYFVRRVQNLVDCGLIPTVVFDGGQLPMKRDENESRRHVRKQNLDKGMALMRQGKREAAEECFQRAVSISPVHAKQVIDALKVRGIRCIVAPYEADSQMAFLARNNLVDLVITEDSDLVAYGCPHILFKLDKHGYAQHIAFEQVLASQTFAGFSAAMFVEMCILSGCDFLPNVPGIGMKKAYGFMKSLKGHRAVIKRLKYSGFKVPPAYEEDFKRALMVFHHQTVYDPASRSLRHLSPIPAEEARGQASGAGAGGSGEGPRAGPEGTVAVVAGDAGGGEAEAEGVGPAQASGALDFLGPHYADAIATRVAAGDLHPNTLQAFAVQSQPQAQSRPLPGAGAFGVGPFGRASQPSASQSARASAGTSGGSRGFQVIAPSQGSRKRPHSAVAESTDRRQGRLSNFYQVVPGVNQSALQSFVSPRTTFEVTPKAGEQGGGNDGNGSLAAAGSAGARDNYTSALMSKFRKTAQASRRTAISLKDLSNKSPPAGSATSKFFRNSGASEAAGEGKGMPPPQEAELRSASNIGNYLRKVSAQAHQAVEGVASDSLSKFALKDVSNVRKGEPEASMLSPIRKKHVEMRSHRGSSKPFQPPAVETTLKRRENIFARKNPRVIGLKLEQYRCGGKRR